MANGFFGQGWQELKRKTERRRLRQRIASHDARRAELLGDLGERAWREKVDLAGHDALRRQLEALEGRAGELESSGTALEEQRRRLEEQQREENKKHDAQRSAVEEKKKPVDAGLEEARQKLAQTQGELSGAQARERALSQEREGLRSRQGAGTADAPAQARLAQMETEQKQVATELERARAALPGLEQQAAQLQSRAQELAGQIERIEAQRKGALQALGAELGKTTQQQQATAQASSGVKQERGTRFRELGEALYQTGHGDGRLAAAIAAIAAEEQARAATQNALESSLAETRAMPRGTMAKFTAAVLGIVLLVIAIPVGGASAWRWWQARSAGEQAALEEEQEESVNPYLHHPLAGYPAYMMADALAATEDRQTAEAILQEVFRLIGLGVYTHEGQAVLRGGERSAQDFFLYDFQLRMLARTQVAPSTLEFDTLAYVLGKELGDIEQQGVMRDILAEAVARRYQEAQQNPYDPNNFIVLFMDGLARRQPHPYSLDELKQHNRGLTPVQTLMMMMEFTLPAPPPEQARRPGRPWSLVPAAQAQSPCDMIQGDGQSAYGTGTGYVVELVEQTKGIPGKIAKVLGNITGVIGAVGDVLTLTGVDILVQPQPYGIHLRHGDSALAGIQTTVTFDAEIVSDDTLKCGWLAGKTMLVKGPVPNVLLRWEFYPALPWPLHMHEATELALHTGLWTKTDASGSSMFILKPSECPDWRPCQAGRRCKIEGRGYMAQVSARIVTADIPLPSLTAGPLSLLLKFGPGTVEYLMGGRKGYSRFRAEWHRQLPEEDQYEPPKPPPG